jgi:hypothetical protein
MSSDGSQGRGIRGVLVLGLVDVAAAALIAVLVFRTFGAYSGVDANPPVCSNASGNVVSCSLTAPVLMLPTFAVALLGLVAWQALRRRARER